MNTNLEKLEFNKILEILKKHCVTYVGKKLVDSLMPNNNKSDVENMLKETFDAVNLSYRNSMPGFYEISNVEIELKNLEVNNTLSCKSLINLKNIFKLSQELKEYFSKDFLDSSEYPSLSPLFYKLYTNKDIVTAIETAIIDENTIDDKASSTLKLIRKNIRNTEQNIRDTLNNFIHSSKYSKYIQENIITMRNNRFVIPVKDEYRSEIKGFVHDISNAGSTVFIEPISIFELNNNLSKLKIDEEIEIEKILMKLSSLFFPYIEEIKKDINLIGNLDFIFAKAKYSREIKGITPKINLKKEINLINARHPLIDFNKVVPISINLGNDFSTLVITGPNTGGKTVTLKTVGLLCAMACSGLNIPADENSSIYIFDKIFADIGDNQSISESLSTFSSHMTNIVEIIKDSSKNSLILVDELGSGTDPIEGANLAISILDYFNQKDILTIATTHYQELKNYALVTNRFENASVEFDIKTLMPTYKLLVGIPGKSNAFEISKSLGLNSEIINNAKSLMSKDQINIEELLKNIYDNKSIIEKERKEIDLKLQNISILENNLKKDNIELKQKEKELIDNAKIKARDIFLNAKEDANSIIKQMNEIKNLNVNIKDLENLRNKLNTKIKNSSLTKDTANFSSNSVEKLNVEDLKPNTEVFVKTLGQNGIIVSHISKSNEVQVKVGIIKMNVHINNIEKAHVDKTKKSDKQIQTSGYTSISKSKTVKPEINVIGLNVEEAVFVVDKFLDDCCLAKLQTVRIVHGKGTGKLKTGIHNFLKTNPHVKSYRMGTYGEGEMGVTVVELK